MHYSELVSGHRYLVSIYSGLNWEHLMYAGKFIKVLGTASDVVCIFEMDNGYRYDLKIDPLKTYAFQESGASETTNYGGK